VLKNERLSFSDYLLVVRASEELVWRVKPGQFAMVQVRPRLSFDPLLRRPLGIFDAQGERLSFLYRVYGRGTELLTKFREGDEIEILAPLGNSVPEDKDSYLFIAGGIGIGGLFLAAKEMKRRGKRVILVYAERTRERLSALALIEREGIEHFVFTEDGSLGERGVVNADFLARFKDFTWVACGPTPMLRAVKEIASSFGSECFLSVDRRMACGVGACLGCTVETKSGYKRCCVEGPIFNSEEIIL